MADKSIQGEKKYGLILPKKHQVCAPKAGNVFGDDEDSENEQGGDWVKKALLAENEKNKIKKQVKLNMQKALEEDSTVFQYDEVYDDMERAKQEEKDVKKVNKMPKYMVNLMKNAERRKREQEYRIQRQVQKDRETEGALYEDKESFVTSAYRAKLEEFKKLEEEDERMERLEAIGDVTKQKDMTGFYRHIYRATVDKTDRDRGIIAENNTNNLIETNTNSNPNSNIVQDDNIALANVDKDESSESEDSNGSNLSPDQLDTKSNAPFKTPKSQRQYRKKKCEPSDSESGSEDEKSSMIEEKYSKDISDNCIKEQKSEQIKTLEKEILPVSTLDATKDSGNAVDKKLPEKKDVSDDNSLKNKENKPVKESKKEKPPKKDIFKKRTVGEQFEIRLQNYIERKKLRLSSQ